MYDVEGVLATTILSAMSETSGTRNKIGSRSP